jgi:hypothetical protein
MRRDKKKRKIRLAEGLSQRGRSEMCDYSLHSVKSRPAKVGDKLTTRDFGTGTRGFAASENANVAVCVLPGTELSFVDEVRCLSTGLLVWRGQSGKSQNSDLSANQQADDMAVSRLTNLSVATLADSRFLAGGSDTGSAGSDMLNSQMA